jgi:hypothetical protein
LGIILLPAFSGRAEDFGDISVSPTAIYTGNTFHGYAETQVILENHSSSRSHTVTLVSPNRPWNNGNSLSRLSRSATLAPGAREIMSLLQPPLPLSGDGFIRVEVDGEGEGQVNAPTARTHCVGYSYSGRNGQPTVLVSRSLDFDAVNLMLQTGASTASRSSGGTTSSASQATGAPGAFSSGHKDLSRAWMPDRHAGAGGNWLELDYAKPQKVDRIIIHSVQTSLRLGDIKLVGVSGTNYFAGAMSAAKIMGDHARGWNIEMTIPTTGEAIRTVRIDFGRISAGTIAIDGVAIADASSQQWASAARASSENTYVPPPAYSPGGTTADTIECLRAESAVAGWSENWLAYTPFDAIALSASDLATMPPAIFNAVTDYLFAGGNVILTGQTGLPATWRSLREQTLSAGRQYQVGFGKCLVFPAADVATLDEASAQTAREVVRDTSRYWQSLPDDGTAANGLFPVVDNLKIPTRGLVVIMLAFVVIIGPVNIILSNRYKRRTWMLWTIPVISFITTLLVFAYSLLSEGITPNMRIAGLTVLDQVNHRAATIGVTAFYCPLTPGGGLKFNFETEATPLVRVGNGSGTAREMDWTQTQHLQHGWVSARVPAHFHLRKADIRRERVEIVNEGGKLKVINGLGTPIKSLWVADASLNLYEVHGVAAGQKCDLSRSTQPAVPDNAGVTGLFHEIGFVADPNSLDTMATKYLLPNTYIAVLDGNPFIENALGASASPKRTRSSAVVYGLLDSPETP